MNVDKAHANRTLRRSPDWIGRNPVRLIPGDPVAAILGTSAGDPALVARLHQQLGLDLPLPAQYAHWIGGVLSGNFGYSYSQQAPVSSLLGQNLIWTIELTFASLVFALIFGTIIGVAAGLSAGRLDPVAGAESALRPARRIRADLPVHCPRPECR